MNLARKSYLYYFSLPQKRFHNTMAKNLLDLNDDVLIDIFIDFTVPELSKVASTCTRLKTIARRVFSLRHKSQCVNLNMERRDDEEREGDEDDERGNPGDEFYRKRNLAVLRNFGDLLTGVRVTFFRIPDGIDESSKPRQFVPIYDEKVSLFNTRIFNLIVMHCTEGLDQLILKWCGNFQLDKMVDATAMFNNVKELTIVLEDWKSVPIDRCLLAEACQLKKLTLTNFYSSDVVKYLLLDYPQLESLTLDNVLKSNLDLTEIQKALKRHPNMNEFHLNRCPFPDLSLVTELPELRKLSILDTSYHTLEPVAQLDKLTQLTLTNNYLEDEMIIDFCKTSKSVQSIEDLSLSVVFVDGMPLMNAVSRLTNLKGLSISFYAYATGDFDVNLLTCLHRLVNLRALAIDGLAFLTTESLIDLVQHLPHLELLWVYRTRVGKSTLSRLCEIYRTRSQKLVIYNNNQRKFRHICREKPIDGENQKESVQLIWQFDGEDGDDDDEYLVI